MKIAIVMSTYNGEKYLEQQLDSLLKQKDVDIYVRDDGSNDNTVLIIKRYMENNNNIFLFQGENVGFRRSFIKTLLDIPQYNYYAFSDQDDYWDANKIGSGIKYIEKNIDNEDVPIVYYSNLKICDSDLNVIKKTTLEKRNRTLESNIMRRSIAGCTMIINQKTYKYLLNRNITDEMLLRGHDSFIISLCYAIGGKIIFDSNAYINYRRHSNNSSGSTTSIFNRIKKEYNNIIKKRGQESIIARSILNEWKKDISDENVEILETIRDIKYWKNRIKIVFSKKYNTGVPILTIFAKIKVIFNLL